MATVTQALYEAHPASPVLGAEITGVDLASGVDEATAERLREDFWKHKVLVFRGQDLSPDAHVEAVRIFDEPYDHPQWVHRHEDNRLVYTFNLDKAGNAATWHVGGTWRDPPFNIESLTYQVVPEVGGRTLWADLQAAYDGLSEPVKELLESVSAVYSAYPGDGTYDRGVLIGATLPQAFAPPFRPSPLNVIPVRALSPLIESELLIVMSSVVQPVHW